MTPDLATIRADIRRKAEASTAGKGARFNWRDSYWGKDILAVLDADKAEIERLTREQQDILAEMARVGQEATVFESMAESAEARATAAEARAKELEEALREIAPFASELATGYCRLNINGRGEWKLRGQLASHILRAARLLQPAADAASGQAGEREDER